MALYFMRAPSGMTISKSHLKINSVLFITDCLELHAATTTLSIHVTTWLNAAKEQIQTNGPSFV